MSYREVKGDLIKLGLSGYFDVISHGVNSFCVMGGGIAPQMHKAFDCNNGYFYPLEQKSHVGDVNKLGQIEWVRHQIDEEKEVIVVNSYTQYDFGGDKPPVDYEALALCMRKMNHIFKGKHIGLPMIGAGLAGGDWVRIRRIIKREFKHCDVTVVFYKP